MNRTDIFFLGTGAAEPDAGRDNTAVALRSSAGAVLLDCPGSPMHKLARMNIPPETLGCVYISHGHPDHIYGLPSLLHSLEPSGSSPEIILPEGLLPMARKLLELFGLEADFIPASTGMRILDMKMDFFKTRHTADSHGIIINVNGKKIVFTSDTGPIPEAASVFRGAEMLIHDCLAPSRFSAECEALDKTHTSSLALGKIAAEASVKKLIPAHFSGRFDFSTEEIKTEIRRNFSGKVLIPQDLTALSL